ncbi:MAG: hypothetical protein JXQ90_15685 [Cyclobacteriaceae bacterium]
MKKIKILSFLFICSIMCTPLLSHAQQKVKERDIIGSWKLKIDVEEAIEEVEEEMDEEDNWLGEVVLRGVSGLVEGVLDNIDIYFEFQRGGELEILVDAFGEIEREYTEWEIIDGRLYIYDSEHLQTDDDDYWMIDGDVLISFEESRYEDKVNENIYLVKID